MISVELRKRVPISERTQRNERLKLDASFRLEKMHLREAGKSRFIFRYQKLILNAHEFVKYRCNLCNNISVISVILRESFDDGAYTTE